MKKIFQKKGSKVFTILFAIILIVGIFFRTYHYRDLLRFNADQARDASVVSDVIEEKSSIPLLGPKAGGTEFRLGPIFYYFQIVSAKIFGNSPDRMAYPDLLFSILTIPLLYLLLRIYFDKKTTLVLVAIFSVSVFAIKYSRFAWNPNSTPFWSMLFLYALTKIASFEKPSWRWSILAGIAIGVGVQLHTLLLIILPAITMITFGYLLIKKQKVIRELLISIVLAVILNVPQLVSEYRSGGQNTRYFFGGVEKKNENDFLAKNMFKDAVCFSQGNIYIISSVNISDTCEIKSIGSIRGGILSLLGLVIFLGGLVVGASRFKKEKNQEKKAFLAIILLYIMLSFAILIPLAGEISMRFFLILAFMPLVLLGLCLEYIREKMADRRKLIIALGAVAVILVISNGIIVGQELFDQLQYAKVSDSSFDNVTLKEIELLSSFIVSHTDSKEVVLDGSPKYISRIIKPIRYVIRKAEINVLEQKSKPVGNDIFYIGNASGKEKILKERIVQDYKILGRLAIYKLGS